MEQIFKNWGEKDMKYLFLTLFITFYLTNTYGQNTEIEIWRATGYESKMKNDFPKAIEYYSKILSVDTSDYDAKLALARLYTRIEDYPTAINFYQNINADDSTDVEALSGLGECFGELGNNKKAISYFEKAVLFLPDEVSQYFKLAKAYENGGKYDEAISVYRKINQIDDTYAESWAGIGKVYNWMEKPKTALVYYKKAIALDPENEKIKNEYADALIKMSYNITLQSGPIQEKEETYTINAITTKLRFEKRLGDNFLLEANFLVDYSNRTFSDNIGDTTRWFNSTWVKGTWLTEHHKISIFGGYSNTDNTVSTYGLIWKLAYNPGKFLIKNTVTAGYDYFYYWNHVGAYSVSNQLQVNYKKIGLNALLMVGIVDTVFVYDYYWVDSASVNQNPFQAYNFSLTYKIVKRPEIIIGLVHSYLNYTYKSPLYYSPMERRMTGASVSAYYDINKFYFYGGFTYKIGNEYHYEYNNVTPEKVKMNVNNWSANIEFGYNFHPFSVALGANNYYNPYYQSLAGFVNFKVYF